MFRRVGVFFTIVAVALSLMALPALADAADNAGKGMNREGSQSEKLHGNDPGQVQGSQKNTADPDCKGNDSIPQETNKGDCVSGSADKPGGSGGFDPDKDWNNGCGNDTDFEDDNNGWCGKNPKRGGAQGGLVAGDSSDSTSGGSEVLGSGSVTTPSPMIEVLSAGATLAPKTTEVLGAGFMRSTAAPKGTAVLGEQLVRGQALAATGIDSSALLLAGLLLAIAGLIMVRMSKTESEAVAPAGITWE